MEWKITNLYYFYKKNMSGKLYLIPNTLGSHHPSGFLPSDSIPLITSLKYLIVEDLRNARRYLKLLDKEVNIDEITFFELNKHTPATEVESFLHPAMKGNDTGIMSEAGLPGIADPGSEVIRIAHQRQIKVVPLVGPSSIFLSLMASGMNGQKFRFSGYLPVNASERSNELRKIEKRALTEDETQIFIETPYRNESMMDSILNTCREDTLLTIAVDISMETEMITTRTINQWKKKKPALHKRPAVFLIGAP